MCELLLVVCHPEGKNQPRGQRRESSPARRIQSPTSETARPWWPLEENIVAEISLMMCHDCSTCVLQDRYHEGLFTCPTTKCFAYCKPRRSLIAMWYLANSFLRAFSHCEVYSIENRGGEQGTIESVYAVVLRLQEACGAVGQLAVRLRHRANRTRFDCRRAAREAAPRGGGSGSNSGVAKAEETE